MRNQINETVLTLIVDVMREFTKEYGYPPSLRELCNMTNVKSTSDMHNKLNRLKSRGIVTWTEEARRTLRVVSRCQ